MRWYFKIPCQISGLGDPNDHHSSREFLCAPWVYILQIYLFLQNTPVGRLATC